MSITLTAIRQEWADEVEKGETRSFTTWLNDQGLSLTGERVQPEPRPPWVDELLAEIRGLTPPATPDELSSRMDGVRYIKVLRDCDFNKREITNVRGPKRYDYAVVKDGYRVAYFKSKGLNRDFILCDIHERVFHRDYSIRLYVAGTPTYFDEVLEVAMVEGLNNCLMGVDFNHV
jgi:hypothetical protein